MEIAKVKVDGVYAGVVMRRTVTAGLVGATIRVEYAAGIWEGLTKTVVFRGSVTKDVVSNDTTIEIPWEVLTKQNERLQVGFYGVDAAGKLIIPTVWADLGRLQPGADPSGDPSTDPSLPVWGQIADRVEGIAQDVEKLKQSGGPSTPGVPGADGEDGGYYIPELSQLDEDTIQFAFTPSKADMPAVEPVTVELPVGQGSDGNADGMYSYNGEKITLTRHKFDYKQLFNVTANGVGMQDGCAYGDYYFQFTPNGRFGVYDLRNNSFVGVFDLDQKDTIVPHCNSASFRNKFYQPEDLFPLVYVNAYNNTNLPLGTCYVHRIMRDGNTFSTQLVQTIQIGFTDSELWISTDNETRPYGNFAVDAVNNFLYAYTVRDGDKVTRFFKFALPDVELLGKNAFLKVDYDANGTTDNIQLNTATGANISSTTYWTTDFLPVQGAVGITVNIQAYRVMCFDSSKSVIGFRDVEKGYYDVDLISGTAYVRIIFHKGQSTFEQSAELTVKGLLHIASTLGYAPENAVDGKGLSGSAWTDATNYWVTGYIETNGHSSCWFNFRPYKVGFYDAEKGAIKSEYSASNTVNIPEGAAYVVAQYASSKNTPFETAQSLVVLEAEPSGKEDSGVTLTEDDIIEYFDTDYFAIPQGCECHNERLYVTSGWGDAGTGSFLHVVDTKTKREVSTVDFINILDGEPEAVTVVDNRLLYGAGGTMYELLV